ncbi:tyrosine kinase receptor Cad96Ca [Scaptodrosophila lebanonensis]|uniref:receptor protein-tyrosine kinase n=1 Tax=Drosophila lebanonensis TaxID=7225 RepID=A0A6J2U1I4_DROLE|nr:tyrosine kinase receptor Cad96Ca [Scaptodrosophila lebanonensis]XP_030382542.1 tyrosine kinase receptor Cad96Ca [Scaptodrosophila lebanonensis]
MDMDNYFPRKYICCRRSTPKFLLVSSEKGIFIIPFTVIAIFTLLPAFLAEAQEQNAPPILYVRERNWRISETEQVGQIIDRVRAEDPDGDELVFGIEPRFVALPDAHDKLKDALPFRIDSKRGVVYLNESLIGRAGQNFLIYITVSDGRYTAKNEVFINILGLQDSNKIGAGSNTPPTISHVVHNISQFLPSFGQLPGVQSIRNGLPNRRPSLQKGLSDNSAVVYPNFANFYPHQHQYPVIQNAQDAKGVDKTKQFFDLAEVNLSTRTKLKPISETTNQRPEKIQNDEIPATLLTIKSMTISIVIGLCGLIALGAAAFGYFCRHRLCAISKSLQKKSKEELVKKSNPSNLSGNHTSDNHNLMAMQQWSRPLAYGNRYVPWDREQTVATSSLSAASVGDFSTGVDPRATTLAVSLDTSTDMSYSIRRNGLSGSFEFPRHRLKFFNILGEGAFGQVWCCEAIGINGTEGVTTVAVKTLKESATEIEKKDLLSELEVMKSLEPHPNVVRLLGCCTEKDPTFVIIEYVNCGKLQSYLRTSRSESGHYGNTHGKSNILTSGDLTSFMYQVAKGMDFLTSRGIIHRDLAARNILIMDDHVCKVADFGFARDIITSKVYERKSDGKLPIRWMATESLYDNIFSVKSDIWSFGVLMWEIVTLGSTPYPGISATDVMKKVRDGYRLEKPAHCRRELYNIMYYCWAHSPIERPTFAEILHMLENLLLTEMNYIELERFPDHNYYNITNVSGEKL